MKMSSVIQPQTVVAGTGQYSYSDMLHGLSWLGSTPEETLMGLNGLGGNVYTVGNKQNMSVMDAIISNARDLQIKTTVLSNERMKAAKADPAFAMKLNATMKKTSVPGTNVTAGIVRATKEAAKLAMQAKSLEAKARVLLKQGDKRAAAAQAVNAMTVAREAVILSTSAEKTRLATGLDSVARTLDAQARYVENTAQNSMSRSGATGKSDIMRAKGLHLRAEADKLRKMSAVVAVAPVVPPSAPTQKRIAEAANKFNIRAVGRGTQSNVTSVLSDLSDSALAQVRDYDGAMQFYGNDAVGRVLCDMEFDNMEGAVKGLAGAIHGMGYMNTLPILAQADRALAAGVREAQTGFTTAVLPAFTGEAKGLSQLQMAAIQLGGLGQHKPLFLENADVAAARIAKWDRACQEFYGTNGRLPDPEQLKKCWNPGFACDVFPPWEAVGRVCRGNISIGEGIAQAGQAIISGGVNIPALPPVPSLPSTPAAGGTGTATNPVASWRPQANNAPPADTMPPRIPPSGPSSGSSSGSMPSFAAPNRTMVYAAVGAGALVLGAGVYLTMFRRSA